MSTKRMETLGLYAKEFRLDPSPRDASFHNTGVRVWESADGWFMTVTVHGNKVVECDRIGEHITIRLRHCGWPTNTTRNVINAVLYGLGAGEQLARVRGTLTIDGDVLLEDQQWVTLITSV